MHSLNLIQSAIIRHGKDKMGYFDNVHNMVCKNASNSILNIGLSLLAGLTLTLFVIGYNYKMDSRLGI